MSQLFKTKSIDRLIEQSEDPQHRLKRLLGPWSLIGLGVGAVIGTGIFVLTGTAAAGESVTVPSIVKAPLLDLILHGSDAVSTFGRPGAGPGIALSFLLTALVCGFAALCYAELGVDDPGRRQRLYLCLRHDGRTHCLDYRMGFDP